MNIKKFLAGAVLGLTAVLIYSGAVFADSVTPSTNDINRTNGWAYVDATSNIGSVTLNFVSTRSFYSCFEYRADGDTNQKMDPTNYNTDVSDGLYPHTCVNDNTASVTVDAQNYVEVRLVFGAERDERFDWTKFDVLYPRTAEITSPSSGQDVYGSVDFNAYLDDNDVDSIQWAVRKGACTAGVGTVFGNVDGHHDIATMDTSDLSHQTFSFTGDMSTLDPGNYCFVYNPVEDPGESNVRKTVEFNLLMQPPTNMNRCKKDGWMSFGNPHFKNQGDCVSWVQANSNSWQGNRKDN